MSLPHDLRGSRKVEPSRKKRSAAKRGRDLRRAAEHTLALIERAPSALLWERLRDIRQRLVSEGFVNDPEYAGTISRIDLLLYRVLGTGHWRNRRQYGSKPPGLS